MLQNIPTHLIAGPLGAGKTSVIRHLLGQRPEGERWAVLVNEFGQTGLDAALLTRVEDGLEIAEVAGGCLCCVNGIPFQVALGRLLRSVRPQRLFIEPSGLGHPLQLLEQLNQSPWTGVLAVQPLVMVLDARALARGDSLPEVQREALSKAGCLIFNKAASVDDVQRLLITSGMPEIETLWTDFGQVELQRLPCSSVKSDLPGAVVRAPVDISPLPLTLWTDPDQPICQIASGEGAWSIGWRWHPQHCFGAELIARVLQSVGWKRAKGVIHSEAGWTSFNGLAPEPVAWRASEWRKDSRIELIFEEPQDVESLQRAVDACRVAC